MARKPLIGPKTVIKRSDSAYPESFQFIDAPPEQLYVIGDPHCLVPGLGVIGARKATPYGLSCAYHFATLAAKKGVCIISGGARGCDGESHKAAIACQGKTVVFLGGGCDYYYPAAHGQLFQDVINGGGAVVSEYPWDVHPMPYMFRGRNRLIAGLAQAVLIVEAGLPSGTFSTADEALAYGKDVLVVPGSINSATSRGSNRLLFQGATPVVDDDSFEQALFDSLGVLQQNTHSLIAQGSREPILAAILAAPMSAEEALELAIDYYGQESARSRLSEVLAKGEMEGIIQRSFDGKWGPCLKL